MFEALTSRLGGILNGLKGKARLSDADVDAVLREIRVALLEADVALPVVKEFVESIKAKAVGADLIKSVAPAQQVIKIVHDEIVALLGASSHGLDLAATPPVVVMMVGLQGSGKTTSTAKIAHYLHTKERRRVMMASLDTQRPAAQEQLRILGEQTNIETLPIVAGQKPVDIARRAVDQARLSGADVLLLDTAGRLSVDDALMRELEDIAKIANPRETLLVVDAMTGQDAVATAQNFKTRVNVTGLVLTRIDGDQRGGAALSLRAVTGQPIKFLGTGEKWDALEPFHPDRLAGRILDQGDVVSLVEKAIEAIDHEDAAKAAAKFQEGKFDLNDLLSQMKQMDKMGGIGALATMLPGLSAHKDKIDAAIGDGRAMKRQEAIILSMTPAERAKPDLLNASRRKRIAAGSGTSVQDINKLMKQLQQMQTMMKQMKKMGMGKMMSMMKGMMGERDQDMMDQIASPSGSGAAMPSLPTGFPAMRPPGLPGLGGAMPPFNAFPPTNKRR